MLQLVNFGTRSRCDQACASSELAMSSRPFPVTTFRTRKTSAKTYRYVVEQSIPAGIRGRVVSKLIYKEVKRQVSCALSQRKKDSFPSASCRNRRGRIAFRYAIRSYAQAQGDHP